MNFWNADSDQDWDNWVHECDEPSIIEHGDDEPRLGKPDDPIVPSACPVCRTPTKREKALCSRCRVVA